MERLDASEFGTEDVEDININESDESQEYFVHIL
jgi:hypothetical protein